MTHFLRVVFSMSILMVTVAHAFGQKKEINISAYRGLSFFRGSGSATTSWMGLGPSGSSLSTSYDKKPHSFYSLEVSGQQITKRKTIYGVGLAFEALTSIVNIDSAAESLFIYRKYAATGKSTLKNSFVTVNLYMGRRLVAGKVLFDLTGGLDLAFSLRGHVTGESESVDKNYHIAVDYKTKAVVDFRPRLQVKVQYEKVGVLLGYSLGLTGFKNESNSNAYSNLLRVGIAYQVR